MKSIVITLITWITAVNSFGQEAIKKNGLTLEFGPGYMMRQDVMFSPFIHSDLSYLNIGFHYKREARLFQKLSLRYGSFSSMVTTPFQFSVHGEVETAFPHSFSLIDLDYQLGKAVRKSGKSRMIIGGYINTDIQVFNYAYGRISSFGYYSAFGLGIFGQYGVTINRKNNITAALNLPLVAWLARPPYMGIDDEYIENISDHSSFKTFMAFVDDGDLVTWNKLQTVDLDIKYTYRIAEKWELGGAYQFEFIHTNQPQNLLSFRHSIKALTTFRF